jgi:hypothetical protein
VPVALTARLWGAALAAGAAAYGVKAVVGHEVPLAAAIAVLGVYGVGYVGGTWLLGVDEATGIVARVRRLLRR